MLKLGVSTCDLAVTNMFHGTSTAIGKLKETVISDSINHLIALRTTLGHL